MKKKIAGLCLGLILVFTSLNSVEAASGWQNIGSWTMSDMVFVTSDDGGDLKVRVNGSKSKRTFKLVRNWTGNFWGTTQTTKVVDGENYTTFTGLAKGGRYKLFLDDTENGSVNITVFD